MQHYISGIQQVGIGVQSADKSLRHYARLFNMDTLVFNDVSEASLMTRYTGGNVYRRRAALSLNMQGGGGFEIWQFQNRQPAKPLTQPQYGDIGIYAPKLKTYDVEKAYEKFSCLQEVTTSALLKDAAGDPHFFITDEYSNTFNIIRGDDWFQQNGKSLGGVAGAVIGVRDMDRSLIFYKWLLQVDRVVYDVQIEENDGQRYRKTLLKKLPSNKGAFGKLLGGVTIELVQCLTRTPVKIYENRFWGDCGFIHLCFDVFDMNGLKKAAHQNGFDFTVDSIDSFEMEAASGRFCYMEDPDGTLIELVETHKVPIFKKWGLYLNLKKRDLKKPLPDWMIKLLALSKVR